MVTAEFVGKTTVVTILDDSGQDNDVEVHFEADAPRIFVLQNHEAGSSDVLALTPQQAHLLNRLLTGILTQVEQGTTS